MVSGDVAYERFQGNDDQKTFNAISSPTSHMKRLPFPAGNRLHNFVLMGHVNFSEVTSRDTYTANLTLFVLLKSFQLLDGGMWLWRLDQVYSETKQPAEK